jgi:hypothetical protein
MYCTSTQFYNITSLILTFYYSFMQKKGDMSCISPILYVDNLLSHNPYTAASPEDE